MPGENFVINVTMTGVGSTERGAKRVTAATEGMSASAKRASAAGGAAAAATAQKWSKAGDTLSAAGQKMNRGVTLPILAIGAVTGKFAVDFDKSMRNVNSIAQLPEPAFQRLSKQVLSLAGPTAQAPRTLAEGMYDLVSSGFDAKESITVLKASADAATAGLTSTEVSTKAVAAALNAYHRPASEARAVSDDLFQTVNLGVVSFDELASTIGYVLPSAATMGIDLKQVGASISTLTKAGQSGANAITNIGAAITSFIKPSKDMSGAIKDLGYESSEQMIRTLGFQGSIEALTKSVKGNKEEIGKLFPEQRAMRAVFTLTGEGAKSAAEDIRGFQQDAGATAKVLAEQEKSVSFQWKQLRAEGEELGVELGTKLLPVMKGVAGTITNMLQGFAGLPEGVQETTIKVLALSAALGPVLRLGGAFATVIGGIYKGIATLKGANLAGEIGAALSMKGERTAALRMVGNDIAGSVMGGLARSLPYAAAAVGITNILSSVIAGDTKGSLEKTGGAIGGAIIGGIAGSFVGNPVLGATIGGAAGSFLGPLIGGLFEEEKKLTPLQKRLQGTARAVTFALKGQAEAARKLAFAQERLGDANRKHKRSAEAVKEAQQRYNAVVRKSGPDSIPAIRAQLRLAEVQRKEKRAAEEAKEAHKLSGIQLELFKTRTTRAVAAENRRIPVLKQTVKGLTAKWRGEKDNVDLSKRLEGKIKELNQAEGKRSRLLKEASGSVGPKWARQLERMSDSTAKFVTESGKIRTTLEGLPKNIKTPLDKAREMFEGNTGLTKAIRRFRGETKSQLQIQAAKHTRSFAQQGAQSFRGLAEGVYEADKSIGDNTTGMFKAFEAKGAPEFNLVPPASKGVGFNRGGVTRVPGSGLEDKVPLYGPGINAVVAPGEDLIVANRHQRPMLDYAVANTFPGVGGLDDFFHQNKRPHAFNSGGVAKQGTSSSALGVEAAQRVLKQMGIENNFPLPQMSGPAPMAPLGQQGINMVFAAAAQYMRKHLQNPRVRKMIEFAETEAAKGYDYVYGGGHGSFSGPYDCSGYVSAILHAGGFLDSPESVQQGSGLYVFGSPGAGREVTIGVRGSSGRNAHTMMSLKDLRRGWRYFESGSGHGAAEVGGWSGGFDFRHPDGFARGGVVRRNIATLPPKAREAYAKYGEAIFDPRHPFFVGWGLNSGGRAMWKAIDQTYPKSDGNTGATLPFEVAAALGEWAGGPGVTLAQIGKSENRLHIGTDVEDPPGRGIGWLAINTAWNSHSSAYLRNPVNNAEEGVKTGNENGYDVGTWHADDYVTGYNLHFPKDKIKKVAEGAGTGAGGEEDVPAVFAGVRTKSINLPSMPKTLKGVEKFIGIWGAELRRYRRAVKKAEGKPKIKAALEKNVTALEHWMQQLYNQRRLLRRKQAQKKFQGKLRRKLGKITGFERSIEEAGRLYEESDQDAEQIVALEPQPPELGENVPGDVRAKAEADYIAAFKAWVNDRERPAFATSGELLADWRNLTLRGQDTASRLESGWEKDVRGIGNEVDQINAYTKKVADDKAEYRKKNPKGDWPDWIKAEIKKDHKERSRLPMLRFRDRETRKTIGEARDAFYGGRKDPIKPPFPPMAGTGSFEDTLVNIQGMHWPEQHAPVKPLPGKRVAGVFGGTIWDWQEAVEGLDLKINQAVSGLGGGGGGGEDPNSERLQLLEEENARLKRAKLVHDAQAEALAQHYLGAYETGGILPGTGFYLGHKGEEVVPAKDVGRGSTIIVEPIITVSEGARSLEDFISIETTARLREVGRSVQLGTGTPSYPGRRARMSQGRNRP